MVLSHKIYTLMIKHEEKRIILQRKSGKALYNVTESLPGDWQVCTITITITITGRFELITYHWQV